MEFQREDTETIVYLITILVLVVGFVFIAGVIFSWLGL